MIINIKSVSLIALASILGFSSCKKEAYSFGAVKTPSALTLATVVAGANTANPNGNGSGIVAITTSATDAISYKIDFGDGSFKMSPSGIITHKYTSVGVLPYTITVNAIGTGGSMSTISKKINVYANYEIPAEVVTALTGNASRTWMTDRDAPGHVGVGPADAFTPSYYAADPNQRDACLYDDEITFKKESDGSISMTIDNKGQSFSIAAATTFYGFGGGDACLGINNSSTKKLAFGDATSASTSANSTRVQFTVPGNGIINFGTGGDTYEILSISPTNIHLRNIGIDGLSWYQKLKVK